MSADKPIVVRVTRRFEAAPERVFDAWLDAEKARKFLFATSTGQMVRADIDARVGGAFNFTDRRDGVDAEHIGEYLEIDRPRRLVFTFHTERGSTDFSRVSGRDRAARHRLRADAHARDRLRSGPSTRTAREAGWTMILDRLGAVLA